MTFPLLTAVALVPILGALLLTFIKGSSGRLLGFVVSLATLALGIAVYVMGGTNDLAEKVSWIPSIGAWYALSADGMARTMVLLTVILVPVVLLAEWNIGSELEGRWSTSTFFALALLLEGLALFVFLADDTLLFYLFFEATLLPMYFLIGGWGGPKRGAAALKFLLYSLAGGLVMLFSVIGVYVQTAATGTHRVPFVWFDNYGKVFQDRFLIADIAALNISGDVATWLWLGFFVAFAIKAPMVPVHTWLPDTAEQSSPGSSTLLVGILDKIGTFGMIKFCLGMFPEVSKWAAPTVIIFALISILYGALMAIGSKHLMRLIAFTSISHFGFMVLGIFVFTTQSITGSIFYMINHGFSTAALFLVMGFLIKRRGSADINAFGGAQKTVPVAAGLFLVAGLSALALPGMSSFVSEFMVMAGAWQRHPWQTAVSTLGTVLAALYILLAYQRTMTGPVTDQVAEHVSVDLSTREKAVLAPLIALILFFGFFPKPMLQVIEPTSKATMSHIGMTDPAPVVKGAK